MTSEEIFQRLCELRCELGREECGNLPDAYYDVFYDVAISLGLTKGQATALADGPVIALAKNHQKADTYNICLPKQWRKGDDHV